MHVPHGMSAIKPLHVLLIEDDDVDVMTVRRAFHKNNITNPLHVARDGLEALGILRRGEMPRPTLVLLDLNMPRMNGIEFLREIRQDGELKTLSVVVLTTSADERDKVEAFKLNVAGYLRKPVEFGDFIDLTSTLHKYWTLVEMP
jgi:CheY-like chemotaxis protein